MASVDGASGPLVGGVGDLRVCPLMCHRYVTLPKFSKYKNYPGKLHPCDQTTGDSEGIAATRHCKQTRECACWEPDGTCRTRKIIVVMRAYARTLDPHVYCSIGCKAFGRKEGIVCADG
jgi:hypothetical protein